MGTVTGEQILQEFFDLWTEKVKGGLTPAAGIEAIKKERPDLFAVYRAAPFGGRRSKRYGDGK